MCAIFGVVGKVSLKKAEGALHSMRHRGSQASHQVRGEGLFIGHYRLAIVDSTSPLTQPLEDDGVIVSFNGEIYNYKALKQELQEYPFTSEGDTEVVLAAYKTWGEAFIHRLEGMFAIAIYDRGELLLYRDRLGEKPLYYLQTQEALVFASELKAIVHYMDALQLDPQLIPSFLMMQTTLAPKTVYASVFSLEPGACLRFTDQHLQTFLYDDILPKHFIDASKDEALKGIEKALVSSIQKRCDTEVPTGYLLSGGVDSAMVCAIAQKQHDKPIDTFTLGYEEYERYDERAFAKEVSEHIGSKHTEVIFRYEDFKKCLDLALEQLDEPINDPAALPLLHLFERLGEKYQKKVILSGEGSDELFLGYRPYRELLDMEMLAQLGKKSWLKNYFQAHYSPHREWEWYRRLWSDEVLFRGSLESFTKDHTRLLVADKSFDIDSFDVIKHHHERYVANALLDAKLWYRYIDLKTHQSDYFLKKLDRVSMSFSIEARAPFMDQNLVKYVCALDPNLFLDDGRTKNLLKDIALSYLPKKIVERKKRGFSYPFIEWMDRLDAWSQMKKINEKVKVFDNKALTVLIDGAKKGKFKQHTFGVYYLLLWLEKHQS